MALDGAATRRDQFHQRFAIGTQLLNQIGLAVLAEGVTDHSANGGVVLELSVADHDALLGPPASSPARSVQI
jgi:hypothetical protein